MIQENSLFDIILNTIGIDGRSIALAIIAATTSIVVYLNRVKNGTTFSILNFFVNSFVAIVMSFGVSWFLRWYAGDNLDPNLEKFVMVFIGISGNKIMELIEIYGNKYLERKAKNLTDEHK